MLKVTIDGRLPGLNDYTKACRTNPQVGARMKKKAEEKAIGCINQQLKNTRTTFSVPVEIEFLWIEKDRRRDPDNISGFGRKVIMDALVKAGILADDSGKYVKGFKDSFLVDAVNPRIEVRIKGE